MDEQEIQPSSSALATAERGDGLSVRPTGGALGAEIAGCDLSEPLTPAEVVLVRRAMLDHGVVFFRRQQLSDEDLVRFTAFFGKPVPHVRKQRPRRVREIFLISTSGRTASRSGSWVTS